MNKRLVILTTHFGTDFSGGSIATCEIFSRIEENFTEVIVVGNKFGLNPFNTVKLLPYNSWWHALKILKDINKEETIFYGDFYNSIFYIWLNIPFYFTYHDNWPELGITSFSNRIKAVYYTAIYKNIFRNAIAVFTVSEFKTRFVKKYNKRVHLVRNGFNKIERSNPEKGRNGILMVGNVDQRKYKLALPLFQLLKKDKPNDIKIDIYGNIKDNQLAKKLKRFSFVNLKGFCNSVPYQQYQLLLHTSLMENLSIVFCEAIYHGIPIVCFDVGGAREIVSAKQGILVTPYRIDDMKNKLLNMVSNPPDSVNNKTLLKDYSWDRASLKYLNEMVKC